MSGILVLPQETLDRIFSHLDLGNLANTYECSKLIHSRMKQFLSNCYFTSKPEIPAKPYGDPYKILQEFLPLFDDEAYLAADKILARLHKSSDRGGPLWKEAVAIALMARRCYDASKYFYFSSLENRSSVKDTERNAFLIAGRFGWYPEPGKTLSPYSDLEPKDKCWAFAWMAYHGNINGMKDLEMSKEAFKNVEAYNPATMAAISGHIDTLKHLQSVGFDLWLDAYQGFPHPCVPRSPLVAASEHGHESVVEYLCGNGSKPLSADQVNFASEAAARNGHVGVLRRIEECYPEETHDWYLWQSSNPYPNGVDWYIFGPGKSLKESNRAALLQHFASKPWYNIHATDMGGNSVLHLAAAEGSLDLFRAIWDSGAISDSLNNAGQSPIELAGNDPQRDIANWLSKEQRSEISITWNEKIKPATMIIEAQRQPRIQEIIVRLLHTYRRKDILDREGLKEILEIIDKQWNTAKMDEKLADIWIHYYSFTAMNAYIDKASKVLEVVSSRETLFNTLFRDLEDRGWFITKSESKEAKAKFRNGAEESRRDQDIARFLFAFSSVYSESQLAEIISGLPRADLEEIETYRQSKQGEMLEAGSEAARGHEHKIRLSFEENLRKLDELSKYR